jgi:outer membrane protein assembly factor BamB
MSITSGSRPAPGRGLALVLALGLGCGQEPSPPPEADAAPPAVSAEEQERLAGLGYVDFADVPADAARGLVVHDPALSYPGYTLVGLKALQRAVLLDPEGSEVWRWEYPFGSGRVRLMPDGDLLVVAFENRERSLARLDWHGRIRWRQPHDVHHDVAPAPGGRLLVLARRYLRHPELEALHEDLPEGEVRVREDGILALDAETGEVVEERWLDAALRARPDLFQYRPIERPKLADGEVKLDVYHANSVSWLEDSPLAERDPIYAAGNVLVTIRNQNLVAIFRWEPWELLWAWGPGELLMPHNATLLENGNLLIFDNRRGDDYSRLVELDPLSREIVWEYRAPNPEDFYSRSRGSAQRLPNGNTLVSQSDEARVFEITPEGRIVWEWRTPDLDSKGRPATFVRAIRHDAAAVDALRERLAATD